MRILAVLFLTLIVMNAADADVAAATGCQGSISQRVPAVVGNGGGLVNVSIAMSPPVNGAGIYARVFPRIGTTTQQSLDQAINYAFVASDRTMDCDVLVSFNPEGETDYIDGPSAGTALTVMTYALLQNKTMRNDTIITGTIEDMGAVGPVGGLYEKAKGSALAGAKYFITPIEGFYEALILKKVQSDYGIRIIQATKVSDVIGFMLDNRSIEQDGLMPVTRPALSLPPYAAKGLARFINISRMTIDNEKQTLASITGTDNDSIAIREFFGNETDRQEKLLAQGYVFSAANEAFLDYIDLLTIKGILSGDADLARRKGELGTCLTSIKRPALTTDNFEWVVGADLRQAWAYDKFDSVDATSNALEDEKFAMLNDLAYGTAWCHVAKSLLASAPQGGAAVDESAWSKLALDKINEAKALNPQKPESVSRLNIAQKSYGAGRFGAAIYDAEYVINNENNALNDTDIGALVYENRTSLWGNVYQSHAVFLYRQNETQVSYTTARFASMLDAVTAEMNAMMAGGNNVTVSVPEAPAPPPQADITSFAASALLLSIFLLIVVIIALTRRTDGTKRKEPGTAYRAKQKKGGTGVQVQRPGPGLQKRAK